MKLHKFLESFLLEDSEVECLIGRRLLYEAGDALSEPPHVPLSLYDGGLKRYGNIEVRLILQIWSNGYPILQHEWVDKGEFEGTDIGGATVARVKRAQVTTGPGYGQSLSGVERDICAVYGICHDLASA